MHIPDGFLSTPVWAAMNVVSVPALGLAARRARTHVADGRIPLMGVLGAFVFAAQMINFPVGVGTSGHLVGGALLAVTLGPAPAAIVMTAILVIQALVFQDGGILALGANVFNMAIAGVLAGYLPFHYLGWRRRGLAVFLGGMLSVFASACLALAQLLVSGVSMPGPVVVVSLGLFLVSAALEGAITVAVVSALERLNPKWAPETAAASTGLGILAVAAVLLAAVGVLFASASPDGLEKLAEQLGIAGQARALVSTPLADYEWKGLESEWFRKALAGLVGLGVVYLLCLGAGRLIRGRRSA
jgi:cobalt/nickel transport system permease protein